MADTFRDCMVRFCDRIFSTPFSSLNLYSVYLLFGILYDIAGSYSIYSPGL